MEEVVNKNSLINLKMNFIDHIHISNDEKVFKIGLKKFIEQPNVPKDRLGLINFWSEQKRSKFSDDAKLTMLSLDYDSGVRRRLIEEKFKKYCYIIYNSSSNSNEQNRFRMFIYLKDPVLASDLKHWRSNKIFNKIFTGCDKSSFAIR